jgi:hypothetical protein
MRKPLHFAAASLIAGALAIGGGAAPTLAATTATTTWSVSPGGHFKGDSGEFTLWDSHYQFGCGASLIAGSFKSGTGLKGQGIGTIKSITLCSDPSQSVTWKLKAAAYHGSTVGDGSTRFNVTGIHFTVTTGACTFVVDGTGDTADNGKISLLYTNRFHRLAAIVKTGDLHFYDVTNCASEIQSGDAAALNAYWRVTPTQTVTSP